MLAEPRSCVSARVRRDRRHERQRLRSANPFLPHKLTRRPADKLLLCPPPNLLPLGVTKLFFEGKEERKQTSADGRPTEVLQMWIRQAIWRMIKTLHFVKVDEVKVSGSCPEKNHIHDLHRSSRVENSLSLELIGDTGAPASSPARNSEQTIFCKPVTYA